jgi:hypothetical protein
VQQPQQPESKRKKPAKRALFLAVAAVCAAAAVGAAPQSARAIIVPTPAPAAKPLSSPTGTPNSTILPLDSSLFFVLDQTLSSRSTAGSVVRAHLRDPIVLAGRTIAAAGSPVEIEVTQANRAQMGNEDGSVEIYFKALRLADGKHIPLITPTPHIDPHVTAGQTNTRNITDTVGDIFIPGHYIYHMLRKGRDVVLGPGTVLRARTAASLSVATSGGVVIATPQPFVTVKDTPHPAFVPAPVYTPPGFHLPTPKPSPSPHPTSTP